MRRRPRPLALGFNGASPQRERKTMMESLTSTDHRKSFNGASPQMGGRLAGGRQSALDGSASMGPLHKWRGRLCPFSGQKTHSIQLNKSAVCYLLRKPLTQRQRWPKDLGFRERHFLKSQQNSSQKNCINKSGIKHLPEAE